MKKLTIYTGCMCSGKSRALIKAFKNAPLDFDVYTFGKGDIVSRGAYAGRIEAVNIGYLYEIKHTKKHLIIDECQFNNFWYIGKVIELCQQYEKVYLAGLDWIQPEGSDTFIHTDFAKTICGGLHEFPFEYTLYGLLAKNDITGVQDARISKRKEGVTDVINKDNYININFSQAFNK